jgi:WhiB family redox-sensing transcriptional regulator
MDMPMFTLPSPCNTVDPEIFFPEDNTNRSLFLEAKSICDSCPNSEPCLAYAVSNPSIVGIWAGTTKRMRDRIRSSSRSRRVK